MDASKDRIISHMNGQHSRELSHYLRHYAGLSSSAASPSSKCVLKDVTLQGMLIRAPNGKEYDVPFDPPNVASWSEVKDRVIAMDVTAREALGLSDVQIEEYKPFHGIGLIVGASVLIYVGCAATLDFVQPGSRVWHAIDGFWPGGWEWYRFAVKKLFPWVAAIHISETVFFDQMRMKKHGVPRWSALWWKWELDVLIEGGFAWKKFRRFVDEKRQQQKGVKSQ